MAEKIGGVGVAGVRGGDGGRCGMERGHGLDPAGPASWALLWPAAPLPPPTTPQELGPGRRRHARAVVSTSLSGEPSTRSRSTPRYRLPRDQKPPARPGCGRLGSVAFAQVSPPPEICCPVADDGGHSRRYWPEGPAPNLPAGSPVSSGYPSSNQRRHRVRSGRRVA